MQIIKINNKGFSLVEILIGMVIGFVVLGAVYGLFIISIKVFKDVKSISDTVQTKTPSIELIDRYFDRWGVGVVSQYRNKPDGTQETVATACTSCPQYDRLLTITTANPCDTVEFYGNLHGFGFVRSVSGTTANLISCRLSFNSQQNCYIIWRNNKPVIENIVGGNVAPVAFSSSLNPNNAACSDLNPLSPINNTQNATSNSSLSTVAVLAGDAIQRTPHKIKMYCNNNSDDAGRLWLYVDLTDQSNGFCTDNEPSSRIAPVDEFKVIERYPATCTPSIGNCTALKIKIIFRSQSQKYAGEYDTYTVERVYGR